MSDQEPADGAQRVREDAAARGIPIEILERPDARSLEEAAALLGVAPATIVKSLVLKRGDGGFVFVLVPGDRQLAWAKLRALLGVNRIQLPDAAQALAATGHARGTITPLGSTTAWPVVVDERVTGRIAMGAGAPLRSAWLDAADLIRGLGATVADISEPAPAPSPAA